MRLVGMGNTAKKGFALPTVLIASVVMMIVLLASLQATSSASASIRGQYNQRLLDLATEAGLNYAKYCLSQKQNPTWTALKPNTDCDGNQLVSCDNSSTNASCWVLYSGQYKTTFQVDPPVTSGQKVTVNVKGTMYSTRTSNSDIVTTRTSNRTLDITQTRDLVGERATKRFWYVGRSGSVKLDFGTSGIVTTPPQTVNASGPGFGEGMTVITDTSGNLLFTSSGLRAYDKNNLVMPGSATTLGPPNDAYDAAEGIGALGASGSTSQGVIAFPINGNGRYMIITNSAGSDTAGPKHLGGYGILTKSIVNMNLTGSNGSIGDIEPGSIHQIQRSELVNQSGSLMVEEDPNGSAYDNYTGQYMTAAPEANGKGYWIVFGTPGRGWFYAVLFNNAGEIDHVVRSATPSGVMPACRLSGDSFIAAYGTMHFNDDYNKLVLASGTYACSSSTATGDKLPSTYPAATAYNAGHMYLRSFDNATGVFGNVYNSLGSQQWYGGYSCAVSGQRNAAYSADFSPNGDYVYMSTIYPGKLYRYRITGSDLTSGATTIGATLQYVGDTDDRGSSATTNGGQVRRAPNGRMYTAQQSGAAIGVHTAPDSSAAAAYSSTCGTSASNYNRNGLTLSGSIQSGLGLPDYSTQYIPRILQY